MQRILLIAGDIRILIGTFANWQSENVGAFKSKPLEVSA
jgi:hypothetical protein